jgi:Mycolic acid cyclopropane synthetase
MTWFQNFEKNWNKLKSQYEERFYRMWKYYLMAVAASFRIRMANSPLTPISFSGRACREPRSNWEPAMSRFSHRVEAENSRSVRKANSREVRF